MPKHLTDHVTKYACSNRVWWADQHRGLGPMLVRLIWPRWFNKYCVTIMQQQSGCGCGSALKAHNIFPTSTVGYGNVAVTDNSIQFLLHELTWRWSVSSIAHLLQSSASPSAHKINLGPCDKDLQWNTKNTHACSCSLWEPFWTVHETEPKSWVDNPESTKKQVHIRSTWTKSTALG